ncbi:MAG: UDP-N-acetylmuramoyl-tripeptide--D-alanyl-D-alanine ligase [Gaiellaceae bacterium]|nr:UDP-N-acetylmuramoyl-tripeptide--D-alanyl-D-alanine ligase [Gaiellaceae bacterium]
MPPRRSFVLTTLRGFALRPRLVRAVPKPVRWTLRRAVVGAPVRRHVAGCSAVTFVAVTGSLGKTTTKDLIAAALATVGRTSKTPGTENGLDGVPSTLMSVRPDDRFAVVEAGIGDQPGEMRWLAGLFEPDVAVLTMLASDHVIAYGTVEAVAREKRALLERVPAQGTVVVDADDPLTRATVEGLRATVVRTGSRDDADVRLVAAHLVWPDGLDVTLDAFGGRLSGRVGLHALHLAPLVPLAVAAAAACGVPPPRTLAAIADFIPQDGRMSPVTGPNGAMLLADDYKSRPNSVLAAIRALGATTAARRVAVLGRIQNEPQTVETYRAPARLLREHADVLVTVGECAEPYRELLAGTALGATQVSLDRASEVAEWLVRELRPGDVALLHADSSQHLARARLRLAGVDVRCDVRRCKLRWPCDTCTFLGTDGPPAPLVDAA